MLKAELDTLTTDGWALKAERDVLQAETDATSFENKTLKSGLQTLKSEWEVMRCEVDYLKKGRAILIAESDVLRVLREDADLKVAVLHFCVYASCLAISNEKPCMAMWSEMK